MDEYIWWDRPGKLNSSVPSAPPQVLWSSWCAMMTIRRWKVSWPRHGSWDFAPHLMRGAGATPIMATWHVLISGVNAPIVWLLNFLLNFSFRALVLKLLFFSLSLSLSPTLNHCFEPFLLQPFSAILLRVGAWLSFLQFSSWGMPFFLLSAVRDRALGPFL